MSTDCGEDQTGCDQVGCQDPLEFTDSGDLYVAENPTGVR